VRAGCGLAADVDHRWSLCWLPALELLDLPELHWIGVRFAHAGEAVQVLEPGGYARVDRHGSALPGWCDVVDVGRPAEQMSSARHHVSWSSQRTPLAPAGGIPVTLFHPSPWSSQCLCPRWRSCPKLSARSRHAIGKRCSQTSRSCSCEPANASLDCPEDRGDPTAVVIDEDLLVVRKAEAGQNTVG
jgi:hypothetical protein